MTLLSGDRWIAPTGYAAKSAALSEREAQLESHFRELAQYRHSDGVKHPVFALEHGLNADERHTLSLSLQDWVRSFRPLDSHRLLWAVYATEVGYNYKGEEYWQTFEDQTPGWLQWNDRYWIRSCFRHFEKTYGGIRPQGAWARHFSIICWPITHAILPVDLQRDLAFILYQLRHEYSADFFSSSMQVGRQISARSWSATPRFQSLAEDHMLVGQIATALLMTEKDLGTRLIIPTALQRIASDLERHRQSREWLRTAREAAKDRRTIKGLGRTPFGVPSSNAAKLQTARQEVARLGLEPRLIVRPSDATGAKWRVFLEIPNLSHLLDRFPDAKELLTNTRCTVASSDERPLARGRVLFGSQLIQLARWPRQDEVLLQFERAHPEIDYLLRTECLLRPGSAWLFEITADGTAVERRSPHVRAGERFLLVREGASVTPTDTTTPVEIECRGIFAALIGLPPSLTEDTQKELRSLNLAVTKSLEVWPAGLSAAWWDGVGHAEWFSGEKPCVAIRSDHEVRCIHVTLAGTEHAVSIMNPAADRPTFLELPDLPLGQHALRITTEENDGQPTADWGALTFTFRVRESVVRDRQAQNGALELELEPRTPSLEDLWEGKLSLMLKGPVLRAVKCEVKLLPRDPKAVPFKKTLPRMQLPVTAESFRSKFASEVSAHPHLERHYDEAKACKLEFDAGQFGKISINCDRAFGALRWIIMRRNKRYDLNFLNDSGAEEAPKITWFTFDRPWNGQAWTTAFPHEAPEGGGLFVASCDSLAASIIAPPVVQSFDDFTGDIAPYPVKRTLAYVEEMLRLHQLWLEAKLSGNFASTTRRSSVLQWIRLQLVRAFCGEAWSTLEVRKDRNILQVLAKEVGRRPGDEVIGEEIMRRREFLTSQSPRGRVDFLHQLARRCPRMAPRGLAEVEMRALCDLACRLLSRPETRHDWSGRDLAEAQKWLLEEVPILCRAARLLVQATEPEPRSDDPFLMWRDL